jgi:hypothetical protein
MSSHPRSDHGPCQVTDVVNAQEAGAWGSAEVSPCGAAYDLRLREVEGRQLAHGGDVQCSVHDYRRMEQSEGS